MPVITCKFIEHQRIGNALFIYCLCRGYAEAMRCELQTAPWVGQKIFQNVNEPPITVSLPQTDLDSRSHQPIGYFLGQRNLDLRGYFQHEKFLRYYSRAKVREWLTLKPEFELFAPSKLEPPYSAAHLRRGDYVTDPWLRKHYCEVSDASYKRAIEKFTIPRPVYRVEEGWRKPPEELEKQGVGWLSDFLLLRDAAHLLRANSSFSVWASWLGNGKTYAPVVEDAVGLQECEFVEGNHPCTAGVFRNQSELILKEE